MLASLSDSLSIQASSGSSGAWIQILFFLIIIGGSAVIKLAREWIDKQLSEKTSSQKLGKSPKPREHDHYRHLHEKLRQDLKKKAPAINRPVPSVTSATSAFPLVPDEQLSPSVLSDAVEGLSTALFEFEPESSDVETQAQDSINSIKDVEDQALSSLQSQLKTTNKTTDSSSQRSLTSLQSAIVWKEILDQPVALRHR
jgi:hypothetical protein